MKGFDKKYKSFPDFILKITKQIWEGKDVNSISDFYTNDIPVRSPFGVTYGNKPVIDATYATLNEFPNRQLLGEDVIWNGNDDDGYHSSHRILSKGTHLGEGYYGKPRQIGFTPKEFAQKIIENEGGLEKAQKLFNSKSDMKSEYKPTPAPKNSVGIKYSNILNKIFNNDYDFSDYARAASIYWPGNRIGHGREDIVKFWKLIKDALGNIKFSVEHIGYLEEPNKNHKASIRWFLEADHLNDTSEFGEATNKNIFIMGINHAEISDGNVIREWVLFDEVAIWKQILMK